MSTMINLYPVVTFFSPYAVSVFFIPEETFQDKYGVKPDADEMNVAMSFNNLKPVLDVLKSNPSHLNNAILSGGIRIRRFNDYGDEYINIDTSTVLTFGLSPYSGTEDDSSPLSVMNKVHYTITYGQIIETLRNGSLILIPFYGVAHFPIPDLNDNYNPFTLIISGKNINDPYDILNQSYLKTYNSARVTYIWNDYAINGGRDLADFPMVNIISTESPSPTVLHKIVEVESSPSTITSSHNINLPLEKLRYISLEDITISHKGTDSEFIKRRQDAFADIAKGKIHYNIRFNTPNISGIEYSPGIERKL